MDELRFKRRWWEALKNVSDEDFGIIVKKVMSYAFTGDTGELTCTTSYAVHLICTEIDEMYAESEYEQAAVKKNGEE